MTAPLRMLICCVAIMFAAHLPQSAAAQAIGFKEGRFHAAIQGGIMTLDGIWSFYNFEYVDAQFVGLIGGVDYPLRDQRWRLGAEVQINRHFGDNDHFELAIPATLRYSPENPWWRFDSFSGGFGLSVTSSRPQTEIERRDESQTTLFYYYLEAAFNVNQRGDDLFFRLHHRSDGYGVFEADTSSNAWALGLRRTF
ncbi:MAG: hypothetical protein AAF678_06130 [Pseudomonadota bacterium]